MLREKMVALHSTQCMVFLKIFEILCKFKAVLLVKKILCELLELARVHFADNELSPYEVSEAILEEA